MKYCHFIFISLGLFGFDLLGQSNPGAQDIGGGNYLDSLSVNSFGLGLPAFSELDAQFGYSAKLPSSAFSGGFVLLGYEYGFPMDMNVYRTSVGTSFASGMLEFQPAGIPFKIEGSYRQFSIRPESENYFRFSFDKRAFHEQLKEKNRSCINSISEAKSGLFESAKEAKVDFAKYNYALFEQGYSLPGLGQFNGVEDYDNILENSGMNFGLGNVLETPGQYVYPEFISGTMSTADSCTQEYNPNLDSLNRNTSRAIHTDSLFYGAAQAKLKMQAVDEKIANLEKYERYVLSDKRLNDMGPKKEGFYEKLKYLQKFQIGQTNPVFSTFMLAQVPINGLTVQYESKKREFNFSHGQVVSPVWAPLTSRQSLMRNLVGDIIPAWNNIGDRITAGSWALTKSEDIEVHFGMLYGLDKFLESTYSGSNSRAYLPSRNGVAELSGIWKVGDGHQVEWAYGQSMFVDTKNLTGEETQSDQKLFKSSAFQIKWNSFFVKPKLETTLEWNRIEPNFKSLGNPFLRDDMSRISGSATKKFKRWNLGISGKSQRNNLHKSGDHQSSIYMFLGKTEVKLTKRLTFMSQFIPMRIENEFLESVVKERQIVNQYISSLIYVKQWRDLATTWAFTGSYFEMRAQNGITKSKDLNTSVTLDWGGQWSVLSSLQYAESTSSDTLWAGQSISMNQDIIYSHKKVRVCVGFSYLMDTMVGNKVGGKFSALMEFSDRLQIEANAEKVVLGSYYSAEIIQLYNRYPVGGRLTARYNI